MDTGEHHMLSLQLPPLVFLFYSNRISCLSPQANGASISLGGRCTFSRVLALKTQEDELLKGKPYLDNIMVEGRIEDEFRGPAMWTSLASQDDGEGINEDEYLLRRILITRIQRMEGREREDLQGRL